jgi:hypothetical protein
MELNNTMAYLYEVQSCEVAGIPCTEYRWEAELGDEQIPQVDVYVDSEQTSEKLWQAAQALAARYAHEDGTYYQVADLQRSLVNWLEQSIEQLVDDAVFHTAEGTDTYAFNQKGFKSLLKKVQPRELIAA